jgi:pimeloyl-ACP methyl ester carboxylesterase
LANLKNAHAVIIGAGDDLPITVDDAQAIYDILCDPAMAGYNPDNITLLLDKEANRQGILKALDDLVERVDDDSSVMLFYSGHGGTYSDNTFLDEKDWKSEEENQHYFHLSPYGFKPREYLDTWVKAEEIQERLSKLNSRRLVFFLDCCHAAGLAKSSRGNIGSEEETRDEPGQADGLAQRIDDGRGMSIISSCREEQKSWILPGDKNSLFTRTLLEVLRGEHKKDFEDPYITIFETVQYIFRTVPKRHSNQNPYANLQLYDDIILCMVPEEIRNNNQLETSDQPQPASGGADKEVKTVFKETEEANNVILFVHGFSGEASETFGQIPEWIAADPQMKGWDMYPFGFSEFIHPEKGKNVWASVEDIERVADHLSVSIKHRLQRYHRVAIVAHSLGGLVAQRAILDLDEKDRSRVTNLLLFATPSSGISDTVAESIWNKQNKDLAHNSDFITKLRKDWNDVIGTKPNFALRAVAATGDQFVELESSLSPFDEDSGLTLEGSHFSIVDPKSKEDDSYDLIINSLLDKHFDQVYSNKEEVNLLLGNYTEVVNRLMPDKDKLDKKGLTRLAFALEGLGREAEALELLSNNHLTDSNSDLMGILGGRYKRKYLMNRLAEDGQKAVEYYKKGLAMAEEKNRHGQIYYLAINLAFLSLVKDEDRDEMLDYAEKAVEHANKDAFDSLWKLATLGEANLYLGQLDESRDFYSRAAEMAGVREKISMHTNAYAAYTSLI